MIFNTRLIHFAIRSIKRFAAPLLLLLGNSVFGAEPVRPLVRLHAHNDYEHKRPLFDALDHGFCSVEADIWLVDGQLLVAHNRKDVKPERSLKVLYLEPLRQQVLKNGGRVYPGGPEFNLLIDIKSDWKTTYPMLRETLEAYEEMLSTFTSGTKKTNAITAIITGNRSRDMFSGEAKRYAALDGELTDLDSAVSPHLVPWISSNWTRTFRWNGTGALPEEEKRKLKQILLKAHKQGRRVRFWGAPDVPAFWRELLDQGVDLINTDDLEGAQKLLLQN